MTTVVSTTELRHSICHGLLFLSGEPMIADCEPPPETDGLDDAGRSGRRLGVSAGLIVYTPPVGFHEDALIQVESWDGEPPMTGDTADHVVDVDFDAPHGLMFLWEPPDTEPARHVSVPEGRLRLRVSGYGFDAARADRREEDGFDSYALRVWPRDIDAPPEVRREWAGWANVG